MLDNLRIFKHCCHKHLTRSNLDNTHHGHELNQDQAQQAYGKAVQCHLSTVKYRDDNVFNIKFVVLKLYLLMLFQERAEFCINHETKEITNLIWFIEQKTHFYVY
jgi:hypothetical protein